MSLCDDGYKEIRVDEAAPLLYRAGAMAAVQLLIGHKMLEERP